MEKEGRPRLWDEEKDKEIIGLLEEYIEKTDIPIIAEFAYLNNLPRETLYDREEFSTLLKKAISKKEAQLERLGLSDAVNISMAVFSLKQLGWSDKQEIKQTGDNTITVSLLDEDDE